MQDIHENAESLIEIYPEMKQLIDNEAFHIDTEQLRLRCQDIERLAGQLIYHNSLGIADMPEFINPTFYNLAYAQAVALGAPSREVLDLRVTAAELEDNLRAIQDVKVREELTLKERISQLSLDIEEQQRVSAQLHEQLQTQTASYQALIQAKIDENQALLDGLESQKAALAIQVDQNQEQQGEISSLREQLASSDRQIADLRDAVARANSELAEIRREKHGLGNRMVSTLAEVEELRVAKDALQQQNEALLEQLAALEADEDAISVSLSSSDEELSDVREVSLKLENAERELKEAFEQLEAREARNKTLREPKQVHAAFIIENQLKPLTSRHLDYLLKRATKINSLNSSKSYNNDLAAPSSNWSDSEKEKYQVIQAQWNASRGLLNILNDKTQLPLAQVHAFKEKLLDATTKLEFEKHTDPAWKVFAHKSLMVIATLARFIVTAVVGTLIYAAATRQSPFFFANSKGKSFSNDAQKAMKDISDEEPDRGAYPSSGN